MRRTRVTVDLAVAACGGSGHGRASGPFAWLRPASVPTGWSALLGDGGRIDWAQQATTLQRAVSSFVA